jgi:hypothetical protein
MGRNDYFKLGTYNAICYVCGFRRKADEMLLRWDGVYVCKEDWEIRQPQDFVRPANQDPESLPWTQPEVPPTFVSTFPPPLTNIVIGTPLIYVNGVLQTSGVQYNITLPQGRVIFTSPPASGAIIAWSGVWLDNSNTATTYIQAPLYTASGFTTHYAIYGTSD